MRLLVILLACLGGIVACKDAQRGHDGGSGGGTGGAKNFGAAEAWDLPNPSEAFNDEYGAAVAVSGETVVVGASRDYFSLIIGGAAHVFVPSGEGYALQTSLRPLSPQENAFFGTSVAIDGDVVAAGAPSYSDVHDVQGAAYFFSRNGTSWVSQQMVVEEPPHEYAKLGGAVAVSGSRALVAAPDVPQRVFVYELGGSSWALADELVAADPAQGFGNAVALEGDTALVGCNAVSEAPAAHVFVHGAGAWTEQGRLVPGTGDMDFGYAVGLSGDTAVVGTEAKSGKGAAYVFVRSGDAWQQVQTLVADDGAEGDAFGSAVAISGDVILVGARGNDALGADSGAAYVFARENGSFTLETKLTRPGGKAGDGFGTAVAIDGRIAVVGSDGAAHTGTATVFRAP